MASTPRITFAIPYRRGREFLGEAIRSVLAQTASDWVLLVVDDCGDWEFTTRALMESSIGADSSVTAAGCVAGARADT